MCFGVPSFSQRSGCAPGLAEAVDGFTSDFGASLFGAAATFLRAGAWAALPADAPLRVTYRIVLDNGAGAGAAGTLSARVTSYVVRTGATQGDEQGWGVAVYGTPHEAVAALAAAAAAADGDDDDAAEAPTRGQALNFVGSFFFAFYSAFRYSRLPRPEQGRTKCRSATWTPSKPRTGRWAPATTACRCSPKSS
jgi:hypothetical protein